MAAIRDLAEADLPALTATQGGNGWRGGDQPIWRQYLDERRAGVRDLLVALDGEAAIGYVSLLWRSHYPPFAEAGIPEISDMVVAIDWRRQGIAEALIGVCEARARAAGHATLGIGFALYVDLGAAQRLYVRLGYKPDGRGVFYGDAPVTPGGTYRIDDDLVLWLTKPLA
jgi:predicted N-acetyltransferase YhbS